jgi:hypothetical protein
MLSINKLSKKITSDFTDLNFVQSDDFCWSPMERTVKHPPLTSLQHIWLLLHEIAHYKLKHEDYNKDINLVQREAEAWDHAQKTLSPNYGLQIDDDFIQDHLNTYRDWLHLRSKCPNCKQNGVQTKNTYKCFNCRCTWQVNEAKTCALRRTRL